MVFISICDCYFHDAIDCIIMPNHIFSKVDHKVPRPSLWTKMNYVKSTRRYFLSLVLVVKRKKILILGGYIVIVYWQMHCCLHSLRLDFARIQNPNWNKSVSNWFGTRVRRREYGAKKSVSLTEKQFPTVCKDFSSVVAFDNDNSSIKKLISLLNYILLVK